jgi:hypothetical protein
MGNIFVAKMSVRIVLTILCSLEVLDVNQAKSFENCERPATLSIVGLEIYPIPGKRKVEIPQN